MFPDVVMICLYADRPQFIDRLVRSFRSQTYQNRWLLVFDNGKVPLAYKWRSREVYIRDETAIGERIGALRNRANACAPSSDILIHADVDDWSYPTRIAEQVEFLQTSGADAVSYDEMLFWRSSCQVQIAEIPGPLGFHPVFQLHDDEAWLYCNTNPACPIGTSLCYWRKTWERNPFANRNVGEDLEWWGRLEKRAMESSLLLRMSNDDIAVRCHSLIAPRMIAAVHGGNTVRQAISPDSENWQRVPEWDGYCREAMKL